MNLLRAFFPKPKPQPLRAVVATKRENAAARRARADVLCQLAVYKAVTTPEQRLAETEAYFERARPDAFQRAVQRGAMSGLSR